MLTISIRPYQILIIHTSPFCLLKQGEQILTDFTAVHTKAKSMQAQVAM